MKNQSQAYDIAVTTLLAVFGSLARLLSGKDKKALTFFNMLTGCFVAAFSGVLAYFFSDYFKFSPSLAYIFAGICGWVGPQVLDMISSTVINKTGLKLDDPAAKKGSDTEKKGNERDRWK